MTTSIQSQTRQLVVDAFSNSTHPGDWEQLTNPWDAYGVGSDTQRWMHHALRLAAANAKAIDLLAARLDAFGQ